MSRLHSLALLVALLRPPACEAPRETVAIALASPAAPAVAMVPLPTPAPNAATSLTVALAGDIIPQTTVLRANPDEVLSKLPEAWFTADARIANFEGTVGSERLVPKDASTLAFAAPPGWLGRVQAAGKFTAFVAANNHGCDLGVEGASALLSEAKQSNVTLLGLAAQKPFEPRAIATRNGKTVCAVAWSTFFNEEKRFADRCRLGRSTPQFARAPATKEGAQFLSEVLGRAMKAKPNCDATIAYIHGGPEYRPQNDAMRAHIRAAAAYVDAVVVSHPHIPDEVTTVRVGSREVPVFLSVGNFVSNQGVAWTPGMKVESLPEDPVHNPWTRVGEIAQLEFTWGEDSVLQLHYGYTPTFVSREGPERTPVPIAFQSGSLIHRGTDVFTKFATSQNEWFRPEAILKGECVTTKLGALPCITHTY